MDGMLSRGTKVVIAIWVVTASSGIVLLLRLCCKYARQRRLWWDDGVLVTAWTILLACSSIQTIEVQLGFGKHVTDIAVERRSWLGFLDQITATLAIVSSAWSRTAFAMTLLQITDGWSKRCVWLIVGTENVAMAAAVIIGWVRCTPVQKIWDEEDVRGSCWPATVWTNYGIVYVAYSGAMNICLALLPWTIFPKLQMRRREKIGAAVSMSMGIFASVVAFAKCTQMPSLASGDFSYDGVELVILGATETSVTIIAGSLPYLRALLSEFKSARGGGADFDFGTRAAGRVRDRASWLGVLAEASQTRQAMSPRDAPRDDAASDKNMLPRPRLSSGSRNVDVGEGDPREAGLGEFDQREFGQREFDQLEDLKGEGGYEMYRIEEASPDPDRM